MKKAHSMILIAILLAIFVNQESISQNPVGYLRQILRDGRAVIATRVDSYAEMVSQQSYGNPKQFIVENDENSGLKESVYYWDGLKSRMVSFDGVKISLLSRSTPFVSVSDLRAGKADTASVVQVLNNGRVYTFRYDAGSTALDDSATVIRNGGRRYVIDADYVTPRMFGAKGDSLTDDTQAFRKAIVSGRKVYVDAGKYRITSTIMVNTSNLKFEGEGRDKVLIFSNNLKKLITFTGVSNVSIRNTSFKIYTSDTTSTLANEWCVGWHLDPTATLTSGPIAYNNEIVNCAFSAPNAAINGVKIIAHRSGFGGLLRGFLIDRCEFTGIGRMGVEVLGEVTGNWYSRVRVTNSTFTDLGKVSIYGMAVSFSGDGTENLVQNITVDGARDIGVENSGAQYTTIENVTYRNLKAGCLPYTVSGYDGYTVRSGNVVINNRVIGEAPAAPQFINQIGMKSVGNEVNSPLPVVLHAVSESSFTGDIFNSTGTMTVRIRVGSSNNSFHQCTIGNKGATATGNAIKVEDTSTNNSFVETNYTKGTGGGSFVSETATSYTPVTKLAEPGSTPVNYSPTYNNKGGMFTIGQNYFWFDGQGVLRTNTSVATNDTQGKPFMIGVPGAGWYFKSPDGATNMGIWNTSNRLIVGSLTDDLVNQLQVVGNIKGAQFRVSALNAAPASATATGTLGEIRITAGFIYVCIATDTWVRATLATW